MFTPRKIYRVLRKETIEENENVFTTGMSVVIETHLHTLVFS